jgi:flagellar motor switch protein FliG
MAQDKNEGKLSGAQKAAVMLLAMGEERGKNIWSALEQEEIRMITHAMVELGPVQSEQVEQTMVDFVSKMSSTGAVMGSLDRTSKLLSALLPQGQVEQILQDIRVSATRSIWQRLPHIDPEIIANYLRSEYPQTVAVIMSRIKPEQVARILSILPEEFAIDVVNRMLRLEVVQKDALYEIEETLRNEFVTTITQSTKRDANEQMAEVFNAFDRQTESRFMSALDEFDRDAAKKIRALMFTFEDLTKLDPASTQTLMRGVDRDTLARAMKGASDPIREFFFGNMSSRAVKNLQDEIQALGPIRIKEVDEAQTKMVSIAKALADKGEILISKNNAEEELVY